MKRIESFENDRNGVVTYELDGGKRVTVSAYAVREYGIAEVLRMMRHADLVPTGRKAVMQNGLRIGTVPPDFDPTNIKSRSFFYDPRP